MNNQMKGLSTGSISVSAVARYAALLLLLAALRPSAIAQAGTAPAAAQQTPPSAPQNSEQSSEEAGSDSGGFPKIKVGTNEVNVVFTVTDKHGKRVTDLKQNDFRFVDDSKPVSEIRSFHAETNLPLQAGLLIDASSSVRDRFKFEQESAIEFLNQTVRRRYDLAFVVGFDATPEVTQDFTDDTETRARGARAASGRGHCDVRRALLCLPGQIDEETAERSDAAGDYFVE